MEFLPAFDKALQDVVQIVFNSQGREIGDRYFRIGLEGAFGDNSLSPRQLNSAHLGTMVSVEGIVTRCSLVRPKVARSVHYCEDTQLFHAREYRDGTSLDNAVPTPAVYPKEDAEGRPLTTEFGLSTYRDHQTISIQEMPERAPAGQLPRPIDVVLDGDLVDRVKPGDRVRLVGAFRSVGKHAASISALFRSMVVANNISLLEREQHMPVVTESDSRDIRSVGKRPDVFNLLATSLAPSVYGHEHIKKALLLLMLGGVEKNLENGTHLRGDINVLLIGDPSVGKSQLLRFVLNLAPLAIATTGRGSSGVGLTAAVTQDKETGERTLEAGAMVLADRGICCIDEFDKMGDADRVAIHEVMEQQTVTIAKAGIHTSLNARCSVLAAANPAFGSYMDEKKPFENITLPDSLLSRFDLVFVVLDKTDNEFNRAIAEHITRLHRFVPDGLAAGEPITDDVVLQLTAAKNADAPDSTPVFQNYNELLHVGIRPDTIKKRSGGRKRNPVEILSIPFLKKYLYYAKTKIKPVLTEDACEYISAKYAELRSREDGHLHKYRTMPLTPRTLETLIRLATAHAKCRLSKHVEMEDAEVAYELLVFALFKEVKPKKKREKRAKTDADQEEVDEDSDSDSDVVSERQSSILLRTSARNVIRDDDSSHQTKSVVTQRTAGHSSRISDLIDASSMSQESSMVQEMPASRFDLFRRQLNPIRQFCQNERMDNPSVSLAELMDRINQGLLANDVFDEQQVVAGLRKMSAENMGLWYQEAVDSILFV